VAILIGGSIRNALDMLDEQPAAVLEVLIEHSVLGRQLEHVA
jgi:hypothetical protein